MPVNSNRSKAARLRLAAAALALAVALCGCAQNEAKENNLSAAAGPAASSPEEPGRSRAKLTDSLGNTAEVPHSPRVVSLYGSYSEAWMLCGGELAGATEDAFSERDLGIDRDKVRVVGSVKEPNLEEIIELEPELVIMSADISNQEKLRPAIENAGIACLSFRVDSFPDYEYMMGEFLKLTGREDLYQKNVEDVKDRIAEIKNDFAAVGNPPKVLLMRASSSALKAKSDDNFVGIMLDELGCKNIAEGNPAMLEDLSVEAVIEEEPDYIFVLTMGSEADAIAYFESMTSQNPAWSGLSAVKESRCYVLPKELFHYKPNSRWGDSYEYLAKLLREDYG